MSWIGVDDLNAVTRDLVADGSLLTKEVIAAQKFVYELWSALPVDADIEFRDFLLFMDNLGV